MPKVAYSNTALFCNPKRIEFKSTEGHNVWLPKLIFELMYNCQVRRSRGAA